MEMMTQTAMPARVRTALAYLEHCRWLTEQSDGDGSGRPLRPLEQRVADAALQVLWTYFVGEMDYGDVPPLTDRGEGDERSPEPAPVA